MKEEDTKVKKLLIAFVVAITLIAMFAAPILGDQPNEPGVLGKAISSQAQNSEKGFSGTVHEGQQEAELEGVTFGNLMKLLHEFLGIPPAHTP